MSFTSSKTLAIACLFPFQQAVVDLTFEYSISIHNPDFCAKIVLFPVSSKFIWLFSPKFSKFIGEISIVGVWLEYV
jgi:hypothetical protein